MSVKSIAFTAAILLSTSMTCFGQTSAAGGHLTVAYTFSMLPRIASNQFAVWIEDSNGNYVRTLFVTNFVSRKAGWKTRPQAVPTWTKAATIAKLSQTEIDSISGATPANGRRSIVWDLRDFVGKVVPPGSYRYLLEANISWEKRVLWTGTIAIDNGRRSSRATPTYSTRDAATVGTIMSDVTAEYEPNS